MTDLKFVQSSSGQYLLILKYMREEKYLQCEFMMYLNGYLPPYEIQNQ